MKVYNVEKTKVLSAYDLEQGHLKTDKLIVAHHEATEAVQEVSHFEVIAAYPNGGKDVLTVIDVPYREERAAYDDYEDIYVYVPYTKEEQDKKKHALLKSELQKVKEDIEQEGFGLVRSDFAAKKARAAEIVNELRILEGKAPREIDGGVL